MSGRAGRAKPRLLCSTGPFYMLPLRQAFEAIGKAGFDGVEVMVTGEEESQDASQLRALAEHNGLEVAVIHAPFLLLTRRVFSTDPLEKIRRSVALAQAAGASTVVVHPAYRWQIGYANWLRRDLEDFARAEETTIAVENMFPVWVRGRGLTFHQTVGVEEMRRFSTVTLDTSHLAVSGIDIVRAFDELSDRIHHIHLSNNLGTGRDTHSPLWEGVLPIGSFLDRVTGAAYDGTITLELDVRPWAQQGTKLASALRDNRDFVLDRTGVGGARPVPREPERRA